MRSRSSPSSLTSCMRGSTTTTGRSVSMATLKGWKSPLPMYRKLSAWPFNGSTALMLHPSTCPSKTMRLSPFPTSAWWPLDSSQLTTEGTIFTC